MSIRLQLPKVTDLKPRITVIGVGGAGGNAINNMIAAGLQGVDFVVANTDAQALATSSAENRIQLGVNLTEGMGAGSKPEIGEAAAEEAIDEIRSMIAGSHMLFVAAGMGGGTGTGAAAVIARIARELGILTVAVVTKPFHFEGIRRMRIAEAGIGELKNAVDTLIVIPNQNLFRIANEQTTFAEAFVLADQVLYSGIACIVDLIIKEGLINLDLADVKTVLSGMGPAMMGTGEASGADRARMAAEEAIQNPLLDDISLQGARGLLVSIIGGSDLTLYEVDAAASRVRKEVDPEANIIVGATFDEALGDRIRVSIVASGMSRAQLAQSSQAASPQFPFANLQGVSTQPVAGKAPPPLPPRSPPPQPNADQLERRLSVALEPGSGHTSQFNGALGTVPLQAAHASDRKTDGRHRVNGITIEERLPEFSGQVAAQAPARAPGDGESGYEPASGERNTSRTPPRMPELSDFSPIAQHEFRVRTEGASTQPPPQRPMTGQPTVVVAESKKPSLLQRITGAGRVRKANAADPVEMDPNAELPSFLGRKIK